MMKKDNPLINKKSFLILSLLKRQSMNFSELQKKLGGSPNTVKLYVDRLVKYEYLKEEKQKNFPFTRVLRLTKKGMKTLMFLEKVMSW